MTAELGAPIVTETTFCNRALSTLVEGAIGESPGSGAIFGFLGRDPDRESAAVHRHGQERLVTLENPDR
jgi:hypothetical protein